MSLVVLLCACSPAKQAPAQVSAELDFRCLWWSEAQMERFDPNFPPPKNTEITIRKWEYSDPVGVPHPDIFDVVIQIKNNSDSRVSDILGEVSGQWRVGPMKAEEKAAWGERETIYTSERMLLDSARSAVFRVPVKIASRMAELERKGLWPWAFRAILTVRTASIDKPLLVREVELPIRPAD
jgi:hypothetical protein